MAASSSSKEKKASRITTACNPCRSRKQKCSGERPACEQCLEYNRVCAWPEQLKRGPAKGYIEALEHRLHETESILLAILPHLSQPQLSSILPDTHSSPGARSALEDGRPLYVPISPLRKRGVEYWKSFPLSNAETIRKWEQDCSSLRRSRSSMSYHEREMDSVKRLKRSGTSDIRDGDPSYDESPTTTDPQDTVDSNLSSAEEMHSGAAYHQPHRHHHQHHQHHHHHSMEPSDDPEHLSPDRHLDHPQEPEINANAFYVVDHNSLSQLAFLKGGNYGQPSVSQELSSWDAAPPVKFQQQFLW